VAIFLAAGSQNYTIAVTDPAFGERGFDRGLGGQAFSLNYTLILNFLEHDIFINLGCYVDTMNKCN